MKIRKLTSSITVILILRPHSGFASYHDNVLFITKGSSSKSGFVCSFKSLYLPFLLNSSSDSLPPLKIIFTIVELSIVWVYLSILMINTGHPSFFLFFEIGCLTVLQPGWQTETLSQKTNKPEQTNKTCQAFEGKGSNFWKKYFHVFKCTSLCIIFNGERTMETFLYEDLRDLGLCSFLIILFISVSGHFHSQGMCKMVVVWEV